MDKLEFTKQLVLDAGSLIKELMTTSLSVEEKSSKSDLVTNVDKACERFLVEGIQKEYQNQSFLTEENTVEQELGDDMWVIDPIDGTTNFIFQKENFSISVAYFHKQEPVFGIVLDVIKDEMYWGHVDVGAFVNDVKCDLLSTSTTLSNALLTGDVYRPGLFKLSPTEMKPKFLTHRFLGSGALETAHVSSGKFHAYVFPKITIWDVAAAMILLKCVGGTWLFGDEHDTFIFDDVPRVFVGASNLHIKNELVGYLEV